MQKWKVCIQNPCFKMEKYYQENVLKAEKLPFWLIYYCLLHFSQVLKSSGFQSRGQIPPDGHKNNLMGHEMINLVGKKK